MIVFIAFTCRLDFELKVVLQDEVFKKPWQNIQRFIISMCVLFSTDQSSRKKSLYTQPLKLRSLIAKISKIQVSRKHLYFKDESVISWNKVIELSR